MQRTPCRNLFKTSAFQRQVQLVVRASVLVVRWITLLTRCSPLRRLRVYLYTRMAGAHAAPVSEWAPRTRPASGCVCTILTSNLMGAHSWGAAAVEIAQNWAIAHGYRYVRFSETSHYNTSARVPRFVKLASENDKPAQFWFKPQAMLSLLERGEEACPW